MGDGESYPFVLQCTRDEGVRVQQRQRLLEFALCVSLKLLSTDGECVEQVRNRDGRSFLACV